MRLLALALVLALALLFWCAATTASAHNLTTLAFDEGYVPLFGDGNLVRSTDDRDVRLLLDRYSGSGFISSDMYRSGFFSATIKLPLVDYHAGIVVAFYTSNGDVFEKTHDELDFEFLGNVRGKPWRIQTNLYGNGSTNRGREERYFLPFDPSMEAHRYSILWTAENIIFYIDDIPIREVRRCRGGDYPSKPMSLYATIWDASNWATSGGRYKVDYKYAPFVSEFSSLVLLGCRSDPLQQLPNTADEQCEEAEAKLDATGLSVITPEQRRAMLQFRERHMTYSFCHDTVRYPDMLPDCEIVPEERSRFRETGHLRPQLVSSRRRRSRRRTRVSSATDPNKDADM